ncbi:MAG: hypothetical protein OEZ13_11525 [Spirochaetia bacterium]|nr:hypothetical protein [Spirochaetia bacterium]
MKIFKLVLLFLFFNFFIFSQIETLKELDEEEKKPEINLEDLEKNEYTLKGEEFYATGKYNEALIELKKAIEEGEIRGEPEFFIGSILEARRKYSESIQYFSLAVLKPLDKEYKTAALWKLILYYHKFENYVKILEYIKIFNEEDIIHPQIEKLKEEAEAKITPEKRMARDYAVEGAAIEKEIFSEKQNNTASQFWIINQEKLKDVIYRYEQAVKYDETYHRLYWKIGFYYEKLNLFESAEETYKKIVEMRPAAKAYYKLGVLNKKNGNFEEAFDMLNTAEAKNKNKNNRFDYFLYINIAQVSYALSKNEISAEYALKAYENDFYKKTAKKSYLPQIIFCFASDKSDEKYLIKKISKELDKNCAKPVAFWDKIITEPKEKILYKFKMAELFRHKYIENKNMQNKDIAANIYKAIFLKEKIKENNNDINNEINVDSGKMPSVFIFLPAWLTGNLTDVAVFLYKHKYYDILYALLTNYYLPDELDVYNEWYAVSSFHVQDYDKTIEYAQKIEYRGIEIEKKLLTSFSKLNQWFSINDEILRYIEQNPQNTVDIILFLMKDESFEGFRDSENYKKIILAYPVQTE